MTFLLKRLLIALIAQEIERRRVAHCQKALRYRLRYPDRVRANWERWESRTGYNRSEDHARYFKLHYNKEVSRLNAKKWREANQEKSKASWQRWDAANKERRRFIRRAWRMNRYRTDPAFNIGEKVRMRIRHEIKKCLTGKGQHGRTIKLLGCTFDELKVYIEAKFTAGMSWDKVLTGEIHLDHVYPVSRFDLADPEQVAACFSYRNLQPLFAADNLSKRDRVSAQYNNTTAV